LKYNICKSSISHSAQLLGQMVRWAVRSMDSRSVSQSVSGMVGQSFGQAGGQTDRQINRQLDHQMVGQSSILIM